MEYFKSGAWTTGITDFLDIVIVSYIIYKLIVLVRGTRAMQLLRGIIVLLAVWAVSQAFGLLTLQWLMNQMFTFGVLAILIIFQPELRRALEQLGRGKLFAVQDAQEERSISSRITQLIRALRTLSQQQIGALIVIERETGLTDYMELGTPLEAKCSTELLLNLFHPNALLHDGAVMVRGNIIMAAGCYLPLSDSPFISKELGTRHRAAIGMSEVSDAIGIVVSEETGRVSIAIHGQLLRNLDEEMLISKLHELLHVQENDKNIKKKRAHWFHRKRGEADG
jgi:diadenylate cyclase